MARWLGLALALALGLAGCGSSKSIRKPAQPPAAEAEISPLQAVPARVPTETAAPAPNPALVPEPAPAAQPEPRLIPHEPLQAHFSRALEFPDCTRLDARSQRWLTLLDRQRDTIQNTLRMARPLMDLVAAELERRDLPIAFALLPMIESRYFPHPGKANGPAGIWQLMPATARGLSVPVSPAYDGRLDFLRSSRAAADLLVHLAEQFERDWRLVDMAFNAGEFRLKKALRRSKLPPAELNPDALGLSRITLHHLAQLEAWTCLLAAAPELLQGDVPESLLAVSIAEPVRVDFLAFMAGIDTATLRRWNPALRADFTPAVESLDVLLPAAAAQQVELGLERIAGTPLARWQRAPAIPEPDWIRRQHGALAEAVIAVNKIAGEDLARQPRMLWLPDAVQERTGRPTATDDAGASVHTVRAGDSLWKLARRYRVALQGLMHWNGLHPGSVLQPGQVLRLRPP